MKAIAVVALLVLVLAPPAALACPTAKPDSGQFYMTASKACTAAQPWLTTDTLTFTLMKRTTCYPSWVPCPGYVVQACDRVTWNFDDGSANQTVIGSGTITHRFSPGKHSVTATVTNALGSAYQIHDLHVGMVPPSFIQFEKALYTYGEADGVAPVTLVRTGDLSRRVPLQIETSDLSLVPMKTSIVFEPGEARKTIGMPIFNDTTNHSWMAAWVWAVHTTGEAILTDGAIAHTNVAIVDDDTAPVITPVLEKTTFTEGSDTTRVRIGIKMSKPIDQAVHLIATVWDVMGTASWGSDWRAQWTEIEIPVGQTEAFYDVEILADRLPEPTETLVIYLGPSTNPHDPAPVFKGWPVTLTILDDDAPSAPATAQINPSQVTMSLGDRAQVHFATRAEPVPRTVSIVSSNPNVAYVMMPEQTLLANYSAMPFTIDVLSPGTATITASLPNGLSATVNVTVTGGTTTPPVADADFRPGAADLAVGGSALIRFDAGDVTNAARIVTLTANNPSVVRMPGTIVIPAGERSASFALEGAAGGSATVTGRLADGRKATMAVRVTLTQAALSMVAPGKIPAGTLQTASITLDPGGPATVTLVASKAGFVSIPPTIELAADGSANVPVLALKEGTVEITATAQTGSGQVVSTTVSVTIESKPGGRRRAL